SLSRDAKSVVRNASHVEVASEADWAVGEEAVSADQAAARSVLSRTLSGSRGSSWLNTQVFPLPVPSESPGEESTEARGSHDSPRSENPWSTEEAAPSRTLSGSRGSSWLNTQV